MKNMHLFKYSISVCAMALAMQGVASDATAQGAQRTPSLVITNEPLPDSIRSQLYSNPVQTRVIQPTELVGSNYYAPVDTLVTQKIRGLSNNVVSLQDRLSSVSAVLAGQQRSNESLAAEYFANVATINTQLQSGTTPGNPRLIERLSRAEADLETLASNVAQLNSLAVEASGIASEATFLLEESRAAFSIAGAVEEDHVQLAQVEDQINGTMVAIERVLNTVNDDITRTSAYLVSERNNLRTLALGVTQGDLYGKSLANRPFSSAPAYTPVVASTVAQPSANIADVTGGIPAQPTQTLGAPRLLASISFEQSDVDYEQPIYAAVTEALERYPNSRFDLVAVHSTNGNAAQVAIESTKARRNAEKVLRSLTQMGLTMDRIDLAYNESGSISNNEVQLFIK